MRKYKIILLLLVSILVLSMCGCTALDEYTSTDQNKSTEDTNVETPYAPPVPDTTIPQEEDDSEDVTNVGEADEPLDAPIIDAEPVISDEIITPDEPEVPTEPEIPSLPPEDSSFEIHFIDVGQADAALILCDGKAMMIDGGNADDSSLIYSYLKNRDIKHLDYVIATHAHEDHIGGLSGALNFATVKNVYSATKSYDSKTFENFVKNVDKNGAEIKIPYVGETFCLGSAEVKILGVNSEDDTNNTSIVLKITYGETTFLFTGDAEREAEQVILDSGADLSSTVLKVGHHGSSTSTTYPFLREIMPEYAVISCGKNNEYGHPHEETLSRLRDADVEVYRTDEFGGIICKSNGKTLEFIHEEKPALNPIIPDVPVMDEPVSDNTASEVIPIAPADFDYILNTNSKKFHYPSCKSVKQMSEKNKDEFVGTRDELISRGYSPCGNCNP